MTNAVSTILPQNWALAELGSILLPTFSRDPRRDGPGEFRYIDIEALDNIQQRITSPRVIDNQSAPSRARYVVETGDVLFSLVRPYLKNIAIIPPDLDRAVASTAYIICRPGPGIDSRYLLNFFRQDSFIESVVTYGNSPPAARDEEFRRLHLPVAPSSEQSRIADTLDELFSDLDAGVDALKRVREKLKLYRASVLKDAVEGRLTEDWRKRNPDVEPASELLKRILAKRRRQWEGDQLRKLEASGKKPPKDWRAKYREPIAPDTANLPTLPNGWCWATPAQVAAPSSYSLAIGPFGSNLKVSDYEPSGVPLIFVRNIRSVQFDGPDTQFVSREKAKELQAHRVYPGDLLVTKMGDPPGDACLYPLDCPNAILTADCIKVTLSPLLGLRQFMVHAVNSSVVKSQILSITKGIAQMKVSLGRFSGIGLPLPPSDEQTAIAEEVDERFSIIDHLEVQFRSRLKSTQALRQSILRYAFTGKLVPQEPSDEPASELLTRITDSRNQSARRGYSGKSGRRKTREVQKHPLRNLKRIAK